MSDKPRVTLVAPGAELDQALPAGPPMEAARTLLARATAVAAGQDNIDHLLFHLFGVPDPHFGDLPVAAVGAVGEGLSNGDGWWLRADPVHITPNQGRLVLLGNRELDLSDEEAEALAEPVRESLAEAGAELHVAAPTRWYLRFEQPPRITTRELARVSGGDIAGCLPDGPDAKYWHALLNEVQMVLHACPANQRREAAGRHTANSVWFWGGGWAPKVPGGWQGLWSTDPVARGLARLSAVPVSDAEHLSDALAGVNGGAVLAVTEPCSTACGEWLERLENDWCVPLLKALRQRQLSEVTLYLGQWAYTVTPRRLLRFWRRQPKLVHSV